MGVEAQMNRGVLPARTVPRMPAGRFSMRRLPDPECPGRPTISLGVTYTVIYTYGGSVPAPCGLIPQAHSSAATEQKGLDEGARMASQWPSSPW
jgi:hypothetical protein